MRIGFVTPEYILRGRWDGGLANYLRKIGRLLADRGHQPEVFVLSDRDAYWEDGPITVHEVSRVQSVRRLKLHGFQEVLAQYLEAGRLAKRVWQRHNIVPFDIVQASSYMAPGYKLLGNGRIPVICRISSYTPLLRTAFGRSKRPADSLSDRLEVCQVLDADAAFAPSQFAAATYADKEKFQPRVIRSPIELNNLDLDHSFYLSNLDGRNYLLFFGTLSRIKGIDLLAHVIPKVLFQHPDLFFVFIGRDDGLPDGQKMFDYLCTLCHPFEEKLLYWPPLAKAQLYPVIINSDGVLMPSRVDNYPNACIEAQTLGIPVIGTDNSSLEEMITDGKTGFLANNGDEDSIYEAVERLLDLTTGQRQIMRQELLDYSQAIASEDRVGQLIKFYEETLASS